MAVKKAKKQKGDIEVVSMSEIARRMKTTRQSVQSWVKGHPDTFPAPILGNGLHFNLGDEAYEMSDPSGRTLYFIWPDVVKWKDSGTLRTRNMNGSKTKPVSDKKATKKPSVKPKPKAKAATTKKAATKPKLTGAKKAVAKKPIVKKGKAARAAATKVSTKKPAVKSNLKAKAAKKAAMKDTGKLDAAAARVAASMKQANKRKGK